MSNVSRILVVDDEASILEFFEIFLTQEGYLADTAPSLEAAVDKIQRQVYDLVLTDLSMPGGDGLEILKEVKALSPETLVVIMTAYATAESAVAAMRNGAYDYLMKPFKVDDIRHTLRNAIENTKLRKENKKLKKQLGPQEGLTRFIGKSDKIKHVADLISRVADNRTSVLLFGESGTGKELAARAIHELSSRADKPFVSINCGAIPENLLESELFGYQKGAFTGADSHKAGLFEIAHGGTLFLDEISELPMHMQVKLLRAIQERTLRRLGSTTDIQVDVRIVSATNKDLEEALQKGEFRQDLYYRLNVIQIKMPPLRERTEDIPLLAQHFLKKACEEQGKTISGIYPEALQKLMTYGYPGNIRELENIIEQAAAFESQGMIRLESLPDKIAQSGAPVELANRLFVPQGGVDLEATLNEYEKKLILDALKLSQGVRKKAADLLHISFRSMRYRLSKHHIDQDDEAV